MEEDIGSADEQPTSNKFDIHTKNEGSLSALFYTILLPKNKTKESRNLR